MMEFFEAPATVFATKVNNNDRWDFGINMTLNFLGHRPPVVMSSIAEPVPIEGLIPKIGKTSVTTVGEGLSKDELELIRDRLDRQQEQFYEHRLKDFKRKLDKIRSMYEYLTAEEVYELLQIFGEDEDRIIVELTNPDTLPMVRKAVALKYADVNNDNAAQLSEEQKAAQRHLFERRIQSAEKGFIATNRRRKDYKSERRLRLDDAVAQLEESPDLERAMEGWSSARIRAYKALKDKPNTYYYRFNAPGEQQRNGPWTKQEHDLFMKRLEEVGADGQWGIFSMAIPGRVGYQCANYYRKLIEAGKAFDDNYVIDQKGKAHYVFGTKSRQALALRPNSLPTMIAKRKAVKKSGKRPRNHNAVTPLSEEGSFSSEGDTNTSCCSSSSSSLQLGTEDGEFSHESEEEFEVRRKYQVTTFENPLPGFTDVITRQPVIRPAISPYGHVLSYDTWLRCICTGDRKNICPFTNQPLHKRQLVMLTNDNIGIYQDIIQGSGADHDDSCSAR